MKIYLAGGESMYTILNDCNAKYVLASYFYLREKGQNTIEKVLRLFPDLFLDSGAFTLRYRLKKENRSAKEIDEWTREYIEEYAEFVNRYHDAFTVVAECDVGSWQDKTRYRDILFSKLKHTDKVLPVVHRADPNRYVEFLTKKYPFVAYAGLKGYSVQENRRYMTQRLVYAKKYGTRIHGFALTAAEIMRRLGMYSVDSASWLHGGKHGMTFYFDGRKLRAYDKFQKWARLKFKDEVKGLGLSWDKFMDDKAQTVNRFNLMQWLKFQDYLDSEGEGMGRFKKTQEEFWRNKEGVKVQ